MCTVVRFKTSLKKIIEEVMIQVKGKLVENNLFENLGKTTEGYWTEDRGVGGVFGFRKRNNMSEFPRERKN